MGRIPARGSGPVNRRLTDVEDATRLAARPVPGGIPHRGALFHYRAHERSRLSRGLALVLARVAPGVTTRLHHLLGTVERYVIQRGAGLVEIDGLSAFAAAGDRVLIPSAPPSASPTPARTISSFNVVSARRASGRSKKVLIICSRCQAALSSYLVDLR